jgi:putative ABC transport system permease protein
MAVHRRINFMTLIACLLSIGLLELLMPFYNSLLGITLTVSWNALPIYLFLVGVIVIVGFLAGSYPAFFLSAFNPIESLKGKLELAKVVSIFRQTFSGSAIQYFCLLIVGTIIIMKQMNYVKK